MSQCTHNANEVFAACQPSKRKRFERKRLKRLSKKHIDAAEAYFTGKFDGKLSMVWFRMHDDDKKIALIRVGDRALIALAKMGVNTKV